MKKKLALLLFALVALSLSAQSPLQVKVLRLSNGFTVWLNEDHSQPKVFGAVVIRAGAKDCPNTGIAHYFEHLLFKGTEKIGTVDYAAEKPWLDSISAQYDRLAQTADPDRRSAIQRHINELSLRAADYAIPGEFNQLIARYGGSGLNAYTSFDETVYHNSFSPQYINQWLELNSERLIDPVFRLFQGELETVYEEKNMYSDQMLMQAAEALQPWALAGTPYAYPIIGATDSLKNPRLSEMRDFYNKYYVAGNMGLMLSGDIQADSLLPALERTFGRIRPGNAPARVKSRLRDFRTNSTMQVKLPIPIVKMGLYAFKAPEEDSPDRAACEVMIAMLSNDAKTGRLDSLAHAGKVFEAGAMAGDLKDFSLMGMLYIPSLPFGSKKKAAERCWQEVNRLRSGQFATQEMEAQKLMLRRQNAENLENVSSRSEAMIEAFSHGRQWENVLAMDSRIAAVTRDDIVRVARTYFNNDSLVVTKKFGRYPKEHVSQPGYKPVQPKNANQKSAYAKQLEQMPFVHQTPRLVNFAKDARRQQLSPLVNLYTVDNPENDVFQLELIYRRGPRSDKRIGVMADYVNRIGTEQYTRQQLRAALEQLGATMGVTSSQNAVTVSLKGFDSKLLPALRLLHEFLTSPKADAKQLKKVISEERVSERSAMEDNNDIYQMVLAKVGNGDSSAFLNRVSAKEMKRFSAEELLDLFRNLQHSQLDIVYSGRLSDDAVASAVKEYIPYGQVTRPVNLVGRQLMKYQEPVVYLYDNPKARQTIVSTYQNVGPLPTAEQRARLALWSDYFGGDMSSVLFQEIREYRALAYYAQAYNLMPDLLRYPGHDCGVVTTMGTQADKTMQAIGVLDSLLTNMPIGDCYLDAARQGTINRINNNYPTFRSRGTYIANHRMLGYNDDPDRQTVDIVPQLSLDDVTTFYQQTVKPQPRVTIIVGNKRTLNLTRLAKLGRIVELKAADIYHK